MPSDFMEQFRAGFQMGQSRNENTRRNQDLQMEQERQRFIRQQQMEELKLKKQELDLQHKRLKQEDTLREFDLAEKARQTQAAAPPPTAAMAGIPQQSPDMAGPPPEQIQIPQPMQQVESVTGGPALQLPKLFGGQIAQMQDAEKQQKIREALGMLDAQEGIKAQHREQPKSLADIFAEAKARAAGGRAGAPLAATSSGSMTGEGGKPLLSGEINKFNDFRSGLNTLGRLSGEVSKTGAASKAGTMIPGFITEMTGAGSEAKSRQAVLDQAKQVVGKAMEGGVLRKEDEAKYMRILPIISDPPEVAKAKLENLKSVMAQDAEIYLETLQAAGRNVSGVKATLEKQLAPKAGGGIDPEVERRLKALGY